MFISGADIIVKTLIEHGCDTVFGYPGGQILNVYDSLYTHQNEINHILTAGGACRRRLCKNHRKSRCSHCYIRTGSY